MKLEVRTPDDYNGDVVKDISRRRGQIKKARSTPCIATGVAKGAGKRAAGRDVRLAFASYQVKGVQPDAPTIATIAWT